MTAEYAMADDSGLVRGQKGKPLILFLGGWALLLLTLSQAAFLCFLVIEAVTPQKGSFGALGIEGLTGFQFLTMLPQLVLMIFLQGAAGYGLVRERGWARPLATLVWLGLGVVTGAARTISGLGASSFTGPVLTGLFFTGIAFWYFYVRQSVRSYYENLTDSAG